MRAKVLAIALTLALGSPLCGQTVAGRLLDEASGQPVAWALVALVAVDGTSHGATISDELGAFVLEAPGPGIYRIRAERLGYRVHVSDPITLSDAQRVESQLRVDFERIDVPAGLVAGRVIDANALRPVEGARVELVGTGVHRISDAAGRFMFVNLPPGRYPIQIEHSFYGSRRDTLALERGRMIALTVRLAMEPIPLAPLVVSVQPAIDRRLDPQLQGFMERRARGVGHFLTSEEIEERETNLLSDVFRGIPGVMVEPTVTGAYKVRMTASMFERFECQPTIFLDGIQHEDYDFIDVDALNVRDIGAIEIYTRPSEVPARFGRRDSGCGVIAFWTGRNLRRVEAESIGIGLLRPGLRVRGIAIRGDAQLGEAQHFLGTLAAFPRDTLAVLAEGQDRPTRIPLATVTRLELSQRRTKHTRHGAITGSIVGFVAGFLYVGAVDRGGGSGLPSPGRIAVGVLSGTVSGGLLGALLGSRITTENWRPVELEGPEPLQPIRTR